jgi:hypothetical protein
LIPRLCIVHVDQHCCIGAASVAPGSTEEDEQLAMKAGGFDSLSVRRKNVVT